MSQGCNEDLIFIFLTGELEMALVNTDGIPLALPKDLRDWLRAQKVVK